MKAMIEGREYLGRYIHPVSKKKVNVYRGTWESHDGRDLLFYIEAKARIVISKTEWTIPGLWAPDTSKHRPTCVLSCR